jgi:hypothetical protein
MLLERRLLLAGLLWMRGKQLQQVAPPVSIPSHVTLHVTRGTPVEADGDVQAAAQGGGAAPVHRKTRI